jgi:hypothetical protein
VASSGTGGIGGYVFAVADGNCLIGARVEIVGGPGKGSAVQQNDCPFGDLYGYMFWGLPVNQAVTLRVSAPGYKAIEVGRYAASKVFQTNFILNRE